MISTIIANIINVLLNYLLIYGKFGFPKLELVGAGIGTFISRIFMVLIIIYLIKNSSNLKKYFENFKFLKFTKTIISKIFNLGYPSALQVLFELASLYLEYGFVE